MSSYLPSFSDVYNAMPTVSDYVPQAVADYVPSVADYVPSVFVPSSAEPIDPEQRKRDVEILASCVQDDDLPAIDKLGGKPDAYERFLNTHGDVQAAAKALKTCLEWRRERKLDSGEPHASEELLRRVGPVWFGKFRGFGKSGQPIVHFTYGAASAELAKVEEAEFEALFVHFMERGLELLARAQAAGAPRGFIEVHDLGGLSVSTLYEIAPAALMLKRVLGLAAVGYPDQLFRGFILNSPMVFRGMWKGVSQVMNAAALQRVTVHGDSAEEEIGALVEGGLPPLVIEPGPKETTDDIFFEKGAGAPGTARAALPSKVPAAAED